MASKIANSLVKFSGIAVLRVFDFLVQTFATNKDVWLDDQFPFSEVLRCNSSVFLQEYNTLLCENELHNTKDFYKVDTDINQDDNWKAAPIILFAYVFKENAQRCPETFKIVSQLPGCCAAMYSVIGPGKHIAPHRGIYKGIYRCLLTLKVQPNADCWIRVNNMKIYFKEGECIVFDETEEHELMNASSLPRVVLYLDFYRNLPFPLNKLNDIIFQLLRKSFFVNNILNEYVKLEKITIEDFIVPKVTSL